MICCETHYTLQRYSWGSEESLSEAWEIEITCVRNAACGQVDVGL